MDDAPPVTSPSCGSCTISHMPYRGSATEAYADYLTSPVEVTVHLVRGVCGRARAKRSTQVDTLLFDVETSLRSGGFPTLIMVW